MSLVLVDCKGDDSDDGDTTHDRTSDNGANAGRVSGGGLIGDGSRVCRRSCCDLTR